MTNKADKFLFNIMGNAVCEGTAEEGTKLSSLQLIDQRKGSDACATNMNASSPTNSNPMKRARSGDSADMPSHSSCDSEQPQQKKICRRVSVDGDETARICLSQSLPTPSTDVPSMSRPHHQSTANNHSNPLPEMLMTPAAATIATVSNHNQQNHTIPASVSTETTENVDRCFTTSAPTTVASASNTPSSNFPRHNTADIGPPPSYLSSSNRSDTGKAHKRTILESAREDRCALTPKEDLCALSPNRIDRHRRIDDILSHSYLAKASLVKISVLILLLATVGKFANQIQGRINGLKSPEEYECVLSSEVVRPAFSFRMAKAKKKTRPRIGLGSAAINSVIEALSPILPFTGGLDLRREVNFTDSENWLENVRAVTIQIQNAFNRKGETVIQGSSNTHPGRSSKQVSNKRSKIKHVSSISAQQPFVSLNDIAGLTLEDVAVTFQYSMESSNPDFDENRFIGKQNARMKKVIVAMRDTVAKSRSKAVKPTSILPTERQHGDVDALKFCAAMRIFAEWRVLRQVPEGYKGYAVGMKLGHKDVVQNVAKIEHAVHVWIDHMFFEEVNFGGDIKSPTLREILQYEIDMNVHPRRPILKDRTGSMGLLWVRRQLQYQTVIFDNVLQIPKKFSSAIEVVTAAYQTVYDKYHGWAVQKIFHYSFQAAPDGDVIYRHMNPHRLKEVLRMAQRMKPSVPVEDNTILTQDNNSTKEKSNPVEIHLNDIGIESNKLTGFFVGLFGGSPQHPTTNKLGGSGSEELHGNELETFVSYLKAVDPLLQDLVRIFEGLASSFVLFWSNIADSVVGLFSGSTQDSKSNKHGGSVSKGPQRNEFEAFVSQKMTEDCHEKIAAYLKVVDPLLQDLARLFEEKNMDDPTRV